MEIKRKVVLREVAGETMLIPVGDNSSEYNGIFTLSPSAAIAFKAFQSGKSEEEALADILSEFDIDKETAKADLDEFVDSLKEFGIL